MQRLNRHIFTRTEFDTGLISPLVFIAHKMETPGDYAGRVYREGMQVGEFRVLVSKDESANTQVDFDLENLPVYLEPHMAQRSLRPAAGESSIVPPEIRKGGGLLFYASTGPGGYHVIVDERKEEKSARSVFDSRHLSEDDVAVIMPIRPGIYQAANRGTTGHALITVSYPKKKRGPMKGNPPKQIKCLKGGFDPPSMAIQPGDAVSFEFHVPNSRLTLKLVREINRDDETDADDAGI